jgi:hypothetical protein
MKKMKLALAIISAIDEILVEPLRDSAAAAELVCLKVEVMTRWPGAAESALELMLEHVCSLEVA